METNRGYNRQRFDNGRHDRNSNHYKRVDEDVYRGAYRFDNESDHHKETTYDGFDLNDSMAQQHDAGNYRAENNQGGDYVYRRSRNTQDNNRHYQDNDRYNNQGGDRHRYNNQHTGRYGDRYGNSVFNNSYAPDPYRNRNKDENYGNMAGSLSFGYDGDYNSDPDYRRRYDPMSGQIRESFNDDSRRRHPNRYGPPDRFGMNPDYDRY